MAEKINEIIHPKYTKMSSLWGLFRLTGDGGEDFLEEYLFKRNAEKQTEFDLRKNITYIPSFSKSALTKVQNSIKQRLTNVRRNGGTETYQNSVKGFNLGVDRKGSSMNKFMGGLVLDELTKMGSVGIYVDAPPKEGESVADNIDRVPYVYTFRVEDIRSWSVDPLNPNKFTSLLLREFVDVKDPEFNLTVDSAEQFRYCWIDESGVMNVRFYNSEGEEILDSELKTDLTEIPFVLVSLNSSLLTDVARHQISLLNLGSADMKYAIDGNRNFLVQQYDPHDISEYFTNKDPDALANQEESKEQRFKRSEIVLGENTGVKVPKGLEYPEFISPPAAPLKVSMEKQGDIKSQIEELMNQTLKNLSSKSVNPSSQTTRMNERTAEDGLKVIGDELEWAENRVNAFWAIYEGSEPARSEYPSSYQFKTEEDRRKECLELVDIKKDIPSEKAQKEISKKIIRLALINSASEQELLEMEKEIDAAEICIGDPMVLVELAREGIIPKGLAAKQIGASEESSKQAEDDSVRRAVRIQSAQGGGGDQSFNASARGIRDLDPDPVQNARKEKDGR